MLTTYLNSQVHLFYKKPTNRQVSSCRIRDLDAKYQVSFRFRRLNKYTKLLNEGNISFTNSDLQFTPF